MSPIELERGSTLTLQQAAGATVHLVHGEAWISGRQRSRRMRAGERAALEEAGTTLIHALENASLRLEGPCTGRMELRRRGW